ncbi:MAG TPA: class D sortase [Patescibacteria group bacterium]
MPLSHKTQKKYRWYTILAIVEGLFVFTALFLAIFIYANWGAVSNEFAFAFKSPTAAPTVTSTPAATATPVYEPAHIIIEKLGVDTPITWDVSAEDTVEYLNKGVAHLQGSAHLGEVGNVFITGHSSDYAWKKNPYAAVFSLVPKLVPGDKITIREHGKAYVYQVAEVKVVHPDQVEVANETTSPVLTLLTCYPVGTSRDRFVVHASLISSPEKPVEVEQGKSYTLPAIKFR